MLQVKPTVYDLHNQKGLKKWPQLHVDNALEAKAAVAAGIYILSCEPDENFEEIRKAVPTAFISAGMPHGSISSQSEAIKAGFALMQRGADAVYCSHSPHFIEAMARESIPVTGHVGLVPNKSTWTNYRAMGKSAEEALKIAQEAKDLENAGAAFLEVEVVTVELADYITRNTPLITMGMGCGDVCDTQYLFSSDVLGTNSGHYPRHSKKYADFIALEAELQSKRVEAFQAFITDVDTGIYPEEKHQLHMSEAEFNQFITAVK